MKSFDELYEEYSKQIEIQSGGLITSDKAEFLKLVIFYSLMAKEEMNEMKRHERVTERKTPRVDPNKSIVENQKARNRIASSTMSALDFSREN